jgi:NAD(P)-dependent dehydrogenase (short-subunit alcohol dehydrogenase family)
LTRCLAHANWAAYGATIQTLQPQRQEAIKMVLRRGPSVVLVTGASSGFGQEISVALQQRGHRVYGTRRNPTAAARKFDTLIAMDVDDDASVMAAVAHVLADAGRIDAVVNNAGLGYAGALEDTAVDEARRQFETNLFGVHRVCRAVLPHMRERRSGHIVNMSSLGGLVTVPFQGMYCASKYALEAYTQALRMEVRPFGIQVAMIEPGDFATGFTAHRRMTAASTPGSPYAARCRSAVAAMVADESATTDIGPVVRAAIDALESDRPPLRYQVASRLQLALVRLRHVLPQRLYEKLMLDHYGAG